MITYEDECHCICHDLPEVKHVMACCTSSGKLRKEDELDIYSPFDESNGVIPEPDQKV